VESQFDVLQWHFVREVKPQGLANEQLNSQTLIGMVGELRAYSKR